MNYIFVKIPRTLFSDHFPDSSDLFFTNQASSLFLLYDYLTSYKKSEKTDEPFLRSYVGNRRKDGRTEGRKDGRTN